RDSLIQDPVLEALIRFKIRKEEGELTKDDLLGLKKLDTDRHFSIESFEGIQHCRELRRIRLFSFPARDLSPLTEIPTLSYLQLGQCPNIDPQSLQGMRQLNSLYLSECGIQDLSFVTTLTGLKSLDFDDNQVVDLSPLAALTGLERLSFENNRVEDLSPILSLGKIHELRVDDTQKKLPSYQEVVAHIKSIRNKD
ncbi:MAG: hypothetical protein KC964_13155, partial [Candidatus Omnitrophica bacterium]|nr:hypothetical protein [Candidatus Omnitrophota bacterium]